MCGPASPPADPAPATTPTDPTPDPAPAPAEPATCFTEVASRDAMDSYTGGQLVASVCVAPAPAEQNFNDFLNFFDDNDNGDTAEDDEE